MITDSVAISALLHKYNALALWDYATGGPYMDINMHPAPVNWIDSSKDAIFISMHKFIGSPDAPGKRSFLVGKYIKIHSINFH